MPLHSETRIVPYTADLMYRIVADVEKYPEFLPWCLALRVLARECKPDGDVLTAEMTVGFGGFRDSYVSRVTLDPNVRRIDVTQANGPFRRLENHWRFTPEGAGARVEFHIEFEFKNPLFNAVAGKAFGHAMRHMESAFEARAKVLSGNMKP
jgi:coenzyme Q-binding protein COQ10